MQNAKYNVYSVLILYEIVLISVQLRLIVISLWSDILQYFAVCISNYELSAVIVLFLTEYFSFY